MKGIFHIKFEGGKMVVSQESDLRDYLATQKDGEGIMTIDRRRKPASYEQTKYYWGYLVRPIADEIGELDQEEVHEWIQIKTGNFKEIKGTKIALGISHMNTMEREEYYSRVRMFASSFLGMYLPKPNEVGM